ncbi:MAG: glycosyltransferase [Weeksellaceae bacterium]|nr:glycosyltransferase [Weeksellaceae bacterium]
MTKLLEKKILFGIVVFREPFQETVTFTNLLDSYYHYNNNVGLDICVYDNTDTEKWQQNFDLKTIPQDNVNVAYFHDPENSGISAAFNYFAKFALDNRYEWIVFLDQDTALPKVFFEIYCSYVLTNPKNNLALPKVYASQKLISPSGYKFYRTNEITLNDTKEVLLKNITAINSGMLIRTKFFEENKGYDKNLRIDFCDHEFVERLNNNGHFADILNIALQQDFSAETDDLSKSFTRYNIYMKDMASYRKNKNKFIFFFRVDLPHLLKLSYKYKSLLFFKSRFRKNNLKNH